MATIKDVASKAGVSIATVSRVFNGSSLVTESTTQRVLEVASRMDYWPNGAARSLSTSRAHAIGVLLPDLHGEFFSETIRGIDQEARTQGYQIILSSSHADAAEMILAARSLRGRVDGFIAMVPEEGSAEAMEDMARNFPVVLLSPGSHADSCSVVSIANFQGAYALTSHLIDLGHRRIAIIRGPEGNGDADERARGYRKALADQGVNADPSSEIPGDFRQQSGYEAAGPILSLDPRPTAVFAANDYMAIGLLSALREAGIGVPGELAVAGFDDIEIAQYLNPPLTTVHVDAYDLGKRAVDLWLAAVQGENGEGKCREVLPATLVVRSSCGAGLPAPEARTAEGAE